MTIDRSARVSFEEVADLYDEVVPGYPEELIEDVIRISGLPQDGRILEIGCGPGTATLPFARRGYHVLGIELGQRLAALAARHCRPYPKVRILSLAFEDWEPEGSAFDLAISADAFHWIRPEIGYPKVAEALRSSGSAAFFWHQFVDPATEWSRRIDDVYRAVVPGLLERTAFPPERLVATIVGAFAKSGCFGEVNVTHYSWSLSFSAERYVKLVRTSSRLRGLDGSTKEVLFTGIRGVVERFGGQIDVPHAAALFHARVKR